MSKQILVLSSAESNVEGAIDINNAFIAELNRRLSDEVRLEWHNYHDIRLEFSTGSIVASLQDGRALHEFDLVYVKSYFRHNEEAAAIGEYLRQTDTTYVCSEIGDYMPLTKLTQLARLARAGLPIPHTLFMLTPEFAESYERLVRTLGTPFIFKAIDGSGGDQNFLIHRESDLRQAVEQHPDLGFIAQTFVPNEYDLRVLIVGGAIRLVIRRRRQGETTHLNNTSQGAHAELVPLEQLAAEFQNMALKAARLMGREVAGVDLMFRTDSQEPYILEVNASPQIGSGAFMDEKLEIYSNYFKNVLK